MNRFVINEYDADDEGKRFSIQSSNGDYLTIADGTNVGTVPLVHTRLEGRDLFRIYQVLGKGEPVPVSVLQDGALVALRSCAGRRWLAAVAAESKADVSGTFVAAASDEPSMRIRMVSHKQPRLKNRAGRSDSGFGFFDGLSGSHRSAPDTDGKEPKRSPWKRRKPTQPIEWSLELDDGGCLSCRNGRLVNITLSRQFVEARALIDGPLQKRNRMLTYREKHYAIVDGVLAYWKTRADFAKSQDVRTTKQFDLGDPEGAHAEPSAKDPRKFYLRMRRRNGRAALVRFRLPQSQELKMTNRWVKAINNLIKRQRMRAKVAPRGKSAIQTETQVKLARLSSINSVEPDMPADWEHADSKVTRSVSENGEQKQGAAVEGAAASAQKPKTVKGRGLGNPSPRVVEALMSATKIVSMSHLTESVDDGPPERRRFALPRRQTQSFQRANSEPSLGGVRDSSARDTVIADSSDGLSQSFRAADAKGDGGATAPSGVVSSADTGSGVSPKGQRRRSSSVNLTVRVPGNGETSRTRILADTAMGVASGSSHPDPNALSQTGTGLRIAQSDDSKTTRSAVGPPAGSPASETNVEAKDRVAAAASPWRKASISLDSLQPSAQTPSHIAQLRRAASARDPPAVVSVPRISRPRPLSRLGVGWYVVREDTLRVVFDSSNSIPRAIVRLLFLWPQRTAETAPSTASSSQESVASTGAQLAVFLTRADTDPVWAAPLTGVPLQVTADASCVVVQTACGSVTLHCQSEIARSEWEDVITRASLAKRRKTAREEATDAPATPRFSLAWHAFSSGAGGMRIQGALSLRPCSGAPSDDGPSEGQAYTEAVFQGALGRVVCIKIDPSLSVRTRQVWDATHGDRRLLILRRGGRPVTSSGETREVKMPDTASASKTSPPALPGIPGLLSGDRLRIGASLIDATGVSRGDSKSHSDATLDETLVFSSANSDIVEMVFRALLEARGKAVRAAAARGGADGGSPSRGSATSGASHEFMSDASVATLDQSALYNPLMWPGRRGRRHVGRDGGSVRSASLALGVSRTPRPVRRSHRFGDASNRTLTPDPYVSLTAAYDTAQRDPDGVDRKQLASLQTQPWDGRQVESELRTNELRKGDSKSSIFPTVSTVQSIENQSILGFLVSFAFKDVPLFACGIFVALLYAAAKILTPVRHFETVTTWLVPDFLVQSVYAAHFNLSECFRWWRNPSRRMLQGVREQPTPLGGRSSATGGVCALRFAEFVVTLAILAVTGAVLLEAVSMEDFIDIPDASDDVLIELESEAMPRMAASPATAAIFAAVAVAWATLALCVRV